MDTKIHNFSLRGAALPQVTVIYIYLKTSYNSKIQLSTLPCIVTHKATYTKAWTFHICKIRNISSNIFVFQYVFRMYNKLTKAYRET